MGLVGSEIRGNRPSYKTREAFPAWSSPMWFRTQSPSGRWRPDRVGRALARGILSGSSTSPGLSLRGLRGGDVGPPAPGTPATVTPDIRPLRLALVGAYGLRVYWSDGHATGIYTFEKLLEVCPCPACVARRPRDKG